MTTLSNKVKTLLSIILLLFFAASMVIPQVASAQTVTPQITQKATTSFSLPVTTADQVNQQKPLTPQASSFSLSINVNSTDNNLLTGELSIKNASPVDIANVYYQINIFNPQQPQKIVLNGKETTIQTTAGIVAYERSKPTYILKAAQTQKIPFSLSYSPNIALGTYFIQANIGIQDKQLASDFQKKELQGSNSYLAIVPQKSSSCVVLSQGKEFDQNIAPLFNPGQTPTAKCTLSNQTNNAIDARYSIDYAVMFVADNPDAEISHISENNTSVIHFEPKQTKDVIFSLPALSTPQVYQAYIRLIDSNNNPSSIYIPFRWSIRGESARISRVGMDKNYYDKGALANISVIAAAPLDRFWRNEAIIGGSASEGTELSNASLSIKIYDKNKILCGEKQQQLPKLQQKDLLWPTQEIKVPIARECVNPKVDVSIESNGKTLIARSIQSLTPDSPLKPVQKSSVRLEIIIPIILMSTLILLFIFYFIRKKVKNPPQQKIVQIVFLTISITSLFLTLHLGQTLATTRYAPNPSFNRGYDLYGWGTYSCGTNFQSCPLSQNDMLWFFNPNDVNGMTFNHGIPMGFQFWTNGSQYTQIDNNTIEITFTGRADNLACGNWLGGFLLTSAINGNTTDVNISNITLLQSDGGWKTNNAASPGHNAEPLMRNADLLVLTSNTFNITFQVTKTSGVFSAGDTLNFDMNPVVFSNNDYSRGEGTFASDDVNNSPLHRYDPVNSIDTYVFCGGGEFTDPNSTSGIRGCMGRVDFPITGYASVRGRVIDASGNPVGGAGVLVAASGRLPGDQDKTTTSDNNGYWAVSDFVPANTGYAVRMNSVPTGFSAQPLVPSAGSYENQIEGGSPNCGLNCDFTLAQYTTIGGRVTNTGGSGISNVDVYIYSSMRNANSTPMKTDANGNYSIPNFVPTGTGYAVRTRAYSGTDSPGLQWYEGSPTTPGSPNYAYENQTASGSTSPTNCATVCNFLYKAATPSITASCSGTNINLSWTGPTSGASYFVRNDDLSNGWNTNCGAPNLGDYCSTLTNTLSVTLTGTSGRTYSPRVTLTYNGSQSNDGLGANYSCGVAPAPATNWYIKGTVFNDANGDGVNQGPFATPQESGITSSVVLEDLATNNIFRSTTAAFGQYEFTSLAAGNYRVRISSSHPGYKFSEPSDRNYFDVSVGNTCLKGGSIAAICTTAFPGLGIPANAIEKLDFGLKQNSCTVSWANVPATIDANNPFRANITFGTSNVGWSYISVYDNGTRINDSIGLPSPTSTGWTWTIDPGNVGTAPIDHELKFVVNDSDNYSGLDPTTRTICTPTASYQAIPLTITAYVYFDRDGNGAMDSGESPFTDPTNITITVFGEPPFVAENMTIASGNLHHEKTNLASGNYNVRLNLLTGATNFYTITSGTLTRSIKLGPNTRINFPLYIKPLPYAGVINVDSATQGVLYGISGLPKSQGGSDFYNNPLTISPRFGRVSKDNVHLVGFGFLTKTPLVPIPDTGTNGSLLQNFMTTSSTPGIPTDTIKGFTILYANKDINIPSYKAPAIDAVNNNCGFNFCEKKYYVYFNNAWTVVDPGGRFGDEATGIKFQSQSLNPQGSAADTISNLTTVTDYNPQFEVTFYEALGDREWSTRAYLMNSTGGEINQEVLACPNLVTSATAQCK